MLKAAEDEHAHAEKEREVFAELVRDGAVALNGDIDHHVAENGKEKRAEQRLGELQLADGPGALVQRGKARELLCRRDEHRPYKVSQPDDRQRFGIGRVVVEQIADLAREEVQSARADDKEPNREEKRADDRIFHRQKYRAAKGDRSAGEHRREKNRLHAGIPPSCVVRLFYRIGARLVNAARRSPQKKRDFSPFA